MDPTKNQRGNRMTEPKHIVSFSGGKDSTAMLFKMIEKKMKIDHILYFDTGWEYPEMEYHIEKVRSIIQRETDIEFNTLKPDKPFEYYLFDFQITKRGKWSGCQGWLWPCNIARWCTREKIDSIRAFYKPFKKNFVQYVGIAYDEPKRIKYAENKRYPLYEWKMTEADCLEYCYKLGFSWGGVYNYIKRMSCFCCPLGRKQNRDYLFKHRPELVERMLGMSQRMRDVMKNDTIDRSTFLKWGAKTIEDWIEYYRQRQKNQDRINNYFDSLEE